MAGMAGKVAQRYVGITLGVSIYDMFPRHKELRAFEVNEVSFILHQQASGLPVHSGKGGAGLLLGLPPTGKGDVINVVACRLYPGAALPPAGHAAIYQRRIVREQYIRAKAAVPSHRDDSPRSIRPRCRRALATP